MHACELVQQYTGGSLLIPGAFVRFEDVPVGLWTPQRGVDLADSERQIAVAPKVLGHGRDAVELPLAILFDGRNIF